MEKEKQCHDKFVEDNPEVNLPMNLDFVCSHSEELVREDNTRETTPEASLKEEHSSPLWTEVVRRGRTRTKINKIVDNDRHILEY
jgi:hypothetical protein